jgi:hypothetical protein
VTQATVVLDQLLHITAFPGGAAGSWTLSLPGYAALLAMSDVLLEAQINARLERELAPTPPALTPEALEDHLARGVAGNDTRWAVTAGQVTMLRGLQPAQGHMAAGLEELRGAGLVVRQGDGTYPSGHGDALAAMLAQLFSCGSVVLSHVVEGKQVMVAFLALFRSVAGLLVANIASDVDTPRVDLVRSTQAGVLLTLRRLLENATPGPELLYQPAGIEAPAPAVAEPAATPEPRAATGPAASEPAPPIWRPTHVVPATGMSAWDEPDPESEPAATLDPGLAVRVDEVDTGWAHVTFSNGWTCWVDAAQLEPHPGDRS